MVSLLVQGVNGGSEQTWDGRHMSALPPKLERCPHRVALHGRNHGYCRQAGRDQTMQRAAILWVIVAALASLGAACVILTDRMADWMRRGLLSLPTLVLTGVKRDVIKSPAFRVHVRLWGLWVIVVAVLLGASLLGLRFRW